MAPPLTESTVVTIFVWPHFQAYGTNGLPLIGGKLYTYAAETSTPKASYVDPYFVTPNSNPVVLSDQGAATVWLDGYYHLRLTDADEVLLWDVPSFTFEGGTPPPPGDLIMGSTEATLQPLPGDATLLFSNAAPAGYRVTGVTYTTTVAWGTANGLTGIALGDATVLDRWALISDLAQGVTGGQLGFHAGDQPIAQPAAYTVIASALTGLFDGTGALHITTYWESLPADTP